MLKTVKANIQTISNYLWACLGISSCLILSEASATWVGRALPAAPLPLGSSRPATRLLGTVNKRNRRPQEGKDPTGAGTQGAGPLRLSGARGPPSLVQCPCPVSRPLPRPTCRPPSRSSQDPPHHKRCLGRRVPVHTLAAFLFLKVPFFADYGHLYPTSSGKSSRTRSLSPLLEATSLGPVGHCSWA